MLTILYIIQQYTIYVGFFLLITGILGNTINIYIFSAVNSYRRTPCTFYFLIASICDLLIILIGLLSRILEIGYDFNLLNSSVAWCKIRQYFIASICIIPFYCQCLATIDQYFVTSKNVYLRQSSTIKQAYWNSMFLTIICLIHGIPFFMYYDISSTTKLCSSMNIVLTLYLPIFVLGIFLFIPTILTIIFGFLTYKNVCQSKGLTNQHADRQLVNMICMQIIIIILATIPYGIYNIYSLVTIKTIKDKDRLNKESLAFTIISLNTYIYTSGSFFVFMISSSRFRQMVKKRIFCRRTANQISPQQLK
ncbi:unnamed protein product [Rotaria sp. Silwood2]|nr:unnamed protein product [Rotaria sp. Silwood2]CAF4539275.1 unnamed protein product [Rotaria sp. Silwood2]